MRGVVALQFLFEYWAFWLALSMSEINENVFNIEIIGYLTKSYPAIKLFFIVSSHSFHREQSLKENITELDSNWNSGYNLCLSHTFV